MINYFWKLSLRSYWTIFACSQLFLEQLSIDITINFDSCPWKILVVCQWSIYSSQPLAKGKATSTTWHEVRGNFDFTFSSAFGSAFDSAFDSTFKLRLGSDYISLAGHWRLLNTVWGTLGVPFGVPTFTGIGTPECFPDAKFFSHRSAPHPILI